MVKKKTKKKALEKMKGLYEPNRECGSSYYAQRISKFAEKAMLPTVTNAKDSDKSFIVHACIHDLEWMHDVGNLT